MHLDQQYWQQRYENASDSWDIGRVSPPIKAYIDRMSDPNLRILIPGCGRAYEASYLLSKGYTNVHLSDWAEDTFRAFKQRHLNFDASHWHGGDFFDIEGQYDLIIEQTFFCALAPQLRPRYAQKMKSLLKPGGHLVGLLFNRQFEHDGPPFGGSLDEYQMLFQKHFKSVQFETCTLSIAPRLGFELWMDCRA